MTKIIPGAGLTVQGLTRQMRYSRSERVLPTAANFPALKHMWDMNHVSGMVLQDIVGTQDITSLNDPWGLDDKGFHKLVPSSEQIPPARFEAPGYRDFILLGCAYIGLNLRIVTIGGDLIVPDGNAAGISFNPAQDTGNYSAFLSPGNYRANNDLSFASAISSSNPVTGCFATVVSPRAGTVSTHWAGRNGSGADYEVSTTSTGAPFSAGSIQGAWPELGAGWTMDPIYDRLEWVALMYFDSGAPTDMEEAMRWMAQYDDIRLYPGWSNSP